MATPERFIGIDVSKGWLDLAELPGERAWRVNNDDAGWTSVVAEVAGSAVPTLVVLEATGGYELGLVTALDLAGETPVVANPVSTRRFAQSLGRRAKTDRIDALMLAHYGDRMRPTPRPVPEATARTLQELLARHQQLTKMLVEEKNRKLQASVTVRPSVEAHIDWLEQQRTAIDLVLASVVASDPVWQARVDQLDSVPGFGSLTATRVAVRLPELGILPTPQLAALVGVAPFDHESGKKKGQCYISGGRSDLRHGLYEALMTTIRCDPSLRAHHQQLIARGKPYKVALVACMRRLLGILNAMIRDGLTWQETTVGQGLLLPSTS